VKEVDDQAFQLNNTPSLQTLSLRRTSLAHLPILKNMKYLNKVEFDRNENVETVHDHTFGDVPTVADISLDFMLNLKTIEKCAFCGLYNLAFIRISDSPKLTSIPNGAFDLGFGYQSSLKTVDFSNNSLTTLDQKMLPWKTVSSLYLAGNKWNCSCDLVWITDLSGAFKDEPKCYYPESLNGTLLSALNKTAFSACRRPSNYRTPKIFIAMTIMLLLSGIVLISWYIWTSRKPEGVRSIGQMFKTNPLVKQPYAYRNLAMHQEDGEQVIGNKSVEPDEEDDAPYPPFDKDQGNKASLV